MTKNLATYNDLPRELVDRLEQALGVKDVRAIEFRMGVDEIATARVEFLMTVEQCEQWVEIMLEADWTRAHTAP